MQASLYLLGGTTHNQGLTKDGTWKNHQCNTRNAQSGYCSGEGPKFLVMSMEEVRHKQVLW